MRWTDIDFETGRISVRHARVTIGYKVIPSEPKTQKGKRSISLDPETLRALRKLRAEIQLRLGERFDPEGIVFCHEDG